MIPDTLQKQVLEQLHINHMRMEKKKILVCESIYWPGINSDIEKYIIIALHVLDFSKCNQKNEQCTMKFSESQGKLLEQTYLLCITKIIFAL